MADAWVRVVRRDGGGVGEQVFMDGNYIETAAVIGTPFETETGKHTFETIDADQRPTWQKTQTINRPPGYTRGDPVVVTLAPA